MSRPNILILTDPSDKRYRTALYGAHLAESLGANAILINIEKPKELNLLMRLYPDFDEKRKELSKLMTDANQKELLEQKSFLSEKGLFVQTKTVFAESMSEILESFESFKPIMIVVPRGESDIIDFFFGSMVENLIRRSPFPVLVHSGKEFKKIKKIITPLALQGLSETSFEMSVKLASVFKSKVDFYHINSQGENNSADSLVNLAIGEVEKKRAESLTAKMQSSEVSDVLGGFKILYTDNRPKEKLLNLVEEKEPDLVVMASSGKKAFQRLYLGSFCEYLVKNTSANILIVKAP